MLTGAGPSRVKTRTRLGGEVRSMSTAGPGGAMFAHKELPCSDML